MLKNKLKKILKDAKQDIKPQMTSEDWWNLEKKYLGRKGRLAELMPSFKELASEEKKEIGKLANKVKNELVTFFNEQQELLAGVSHSDGSFDVTLPGHPVAAGSLHPITKVIYDLNDAFLSLGFELYEGLEVSSEDFVFDNLNFSKAHPARESMDTFWVDGGSKENKIRLCLRPHLTGASVRYMQEHKPPFRFVYPGRVFRSETTDAGHERCFYQYEALLVDKHVPFSSGQLLIQTILEKVFGRQVKTRMRAGFFPFVEPGFEIDMECLVCQGKGCSVCKHNGWLEMMPGGPPHPNVFKAGRIDSNKWQGFYINVGLDRMVMMKYAIDDIRLFNSGDLRFLKQWQSNL